MKIKLSVVKDANTIKYNTRNSRFVNLVNIFRVRSALYLQTNDLGLFKHRIDFAKKHFELPYTYSGISTEREPFGPQSARMSSIRLAAPAKQQTLCTIRTA